jgi:sensor histidine kinase YesM
MQLHFFPRDRQFWLYHCSALAVGLSVTIAMTVWWGYMAQYQIASSVAWLPLYTLAALAFRWLYQRYAGETIPMGRLIAFAVLYSAVTGVVMAAILQTLVLPLFWDGFLAKFTHFKMSTDYTEFLFRRIREDVPQNQMFVLVWSFIYISVTANRRVRKTELFNLRLQNSLKDAQLSSLSNQLNPHFLFNSLNNIRFMIHEDAQCADRMIISFSEILRYSLESSKQEKIRLGQEVAIIEKYIAIVRTQLEERLRFDMRIDAALHDALVPPMVLQMLVENAIKHGLEQLHAGGTLTLEAARDEGQLVFKVCNDTPPMQGKPRDGLGIGLRNIVQRLSLLYGERASLAVDHSETQFKVALTLPLEHAA